MPHDDDAAADAAAAAEPAPAPLLAEQGVYLPQGRASWQIGELLLYPDRLVFAQPRGVRFAMPFANLLAVAVERKHYVVVRKPALAVTFQDPRLRDPSTAWFLTPRLGQWVAQLTAILNGEPPAAAGADTPARAGSADFTDRTDRTDRTGWSDGTDRTDRADWTYRERNGSRGMGGGPSLQLGSLKGAAPASGQPRARMQSPAQMHPPILGQPPGASPDPFTRPQPAVEGRVLRPPQAHPHTGDRPPLSPQALARLGAQLDPTSRSLLAHLAEVSHAPIRELAAVIGAPSDMAVLFCIRHHINPAAQALLGRPVLFFVEAQLDRVTGQMVPFAWWLAGRRGRAPAPAAAPYELHDEGPTLTVLLELVGADPATIRCTAHGTRLAVTAAGPAQQWHNDIVLPAPVQSTASGQRFNNGILSLQLVKTPAQED